MVAHILLNINDLNIYFTVDVLNNFKMLQILNLTRRGCMRTAIYSHSASTAATIIKPSLEKNEANNGDRKIESYQKNSGTEQQGKY